MTDHLLNLHTDVLAAMRRAPRGFSRIAAGLSETDDGHDADLDVFRARLAASDPGLITVWSRSLAQWDAALTADWSSAPPCSDARRADAYALLRFDQDVSEALDAAVPVDKGPQPVVISESNQAWYTRDKALARAFYWPAYEDLLRSKGWSEKAVTSLGEAAHNVVERLSDPARPEAYAARGLVVGYVQSGKTANFTGVIAKAMDAGYRLVIVLGGTLNLLRGQTQRRLDMELIGQENILRGADPDDLDALIGVDYQDDEDWPTKFVSHGGRPSHRGAFDIERLTTKDKDYQSLERGIRALDIEKVEKALPLHDPANLHHAAARVMVVKKNKSVLTKLVNDLKKIGPILGEVPALIIDDESDQASVNTTNPASWEEGKANRSAINGLVCELLRLMPRAQYIGYTATPFANVFVDPDDSADLFPRDFLISLPRPVGYMGVEDFHDLHSDVPSSERTVATSQEAAHVRGVDSGTGDRLLEAMDAFVLAGALKLYRVANGFPEGAFRHHTMLVHESVRVADHAVLADRIKALWDSSYMSSESHLRLAALFEADHKPVCEARAEGLPVPGSYEELRAHISRARQLIASGGSPVLVVNGANEKDYAQPGLDFDRTPNVWKILVGGTKLSRGFTVEGLTVTYYRRMTQQADTLMQMGRWFGFRSGYRDLVRLYIGREEPFGKDKTLDLYEAFEAICQDEEAFRSELAQYAEMIDGEPQLTPYEVLPLVSQHLGLVKPTARNKMFNAELTEIRSPGRPIEPAAYPKDPSVIEANAKRWLPLLDVFGRSAQTLELPPDETSPLTRRFEAKTSLVPHTSLVSVLRKLEWEGDNHFAPHLSYLAKLDGELAKVDDWLLVAPQTTSSRRVEASVLGSAPTSLVRRRRQFEKVAFGRISGMEHRRWAESVIREAGEDVSSSRADALSVGPRTGIVLLYPVVDATNDAGLLSAVTDGTADPKQVIMAFTVVSPTTANDSSNRLLRFRAIRSGGTAE
ncbi:Z1 domain-containing protein [Streptomyces sp. NPDC006463]|uniref:Z1 domain-containing protein n=1 Tax=Streptomyces sp. NPDC006463 TaxID=3364746 RepID=UPI0036ABB017